MAYHKDMTAAPSKQAQPSLPPIVSAQEWQAKFSELARQEKVATTARQAQSAARRRMPMALVEKDYRFLGPKGEMSLPDLFAGRKQLILYRFFYEPGVADWPSGACRGCSIFADSITHPDHLAARDTSLAFVSPAPQHLIVAYRARMGWTIPWYTLIGDDFSRDFGVQEWAGINVFLHQDGRAYRTYFLNGPELQAVGTVWSLLELTPFGLQETTEESPPGWPQGQPRAWYQLHDEYESPQELD
jgi:predicted dithiol-disulfide oxidoreductase (DUF899 family)